MFETMVRCGDTLAAVVYALDPDAVSGPATREWWAALDRIERLAAAGKTLLARRVAATNKPEKAGAKTGAEELGRGGMREGEGRGRPGPRGHQRPAAPGSAVAALHR